MRKQLGVAALALNDVITKEYATLSNNPYKPTDGFTTLRRDGVINNQTILVSGRQNFTMIYLEAGFVANFITLWSGSTAAATPTNQIFSVYSALGARLAQTTNNTTTAWASGVLKKLGLTAAWTVPTTGLYYIGCMVSATTVPSLQGSTCTVTTIAGLLPITMAADTVNTGLTTTIPATATASATNQGFMAHLSNA